MKLEQLKSEGGRWGFTGRVPMELARKTWPDRCGAKQSAERVGYAVLDDGSCISDDDPSPLRVKSDDGIGTRHT